MELLEPVRLTAAILVVAGLLAILGWALRRFDFGQQGKGRGGRLAVVETRWLDQRHRLLLIRRDAVEHLVLLTPSGPLLVEQGTVAPSLSPHHMPSQGEPA